MFFPTLEDTSGYMEFERFELRRRFGDAKAKKIQAFAKKICRFRN